jgi:hypothetical protein
MSAQGLARVWWSRVSPAEAAVSVAVPGAHLFGRASAQLTTTAEPARKLTRANDFMGLAALLRNFFRPQLPSRRHSE